MKRASVPVGGSRKDEGRSVVGVSAFSSGDHSPGNCKVVKENGEKSGETIINFCKPVRANTLNKEMEF